MEKESLADFKASLSEPLAPVHLSVYGKALWWAGKGNWDMAHELIQNLDDPSAARIHAYLHRLEGDLSNAQYWYSKANGKMPSVTLYQEWEYLVNNFILNFKKLS
jgi:hypothetical protein